MARHAYVLLVVSSVVASGPLLAQPAPNVSPQAPPAAPQQTAPAPPQAGAEAPNAAPAPSGSPPPQYYVEPAAPPATAEQRPAPPQNQPGVYEPPPPGYGPQLVWEPPPPPKPRHVAPKYSFWLGPRVGWFIPFGSLWYRCVPVQGLCNFTAVDWNDYASAGPMFELDAGARLGRNYNLFLLWEHAALGEGEDESIARARGGFDFADTDYFGLGLRVSSDPDKVGFLTEINLGTRRFRAVYNDGSELQLTEEIPFEARIGLGADIRIGPAFSLSPLITLGIGRFENVDRVAPDGSTTGELSDLDELASHGWLTFQLGAHFDVAGGG